MELKQQLHLSQQLIITPQLIETNPVLEDDSFQTIESEGKKEEEEEKEEFLRYFWEQYAQDSYLKERGLQEREEHEDTFLENISVKSSSLDEHLLWQLRFAEMTQKEKQIAQFIIGNLNGDGYLVNPLEEIANQTKVDLQEVERVLQKIQEFDPPGIAARDLKECLLLQLKYFKVKNPLVKTIITDYLHFLEKKDLKGIANHLKVPIEKIREAVEIILQLEPKPGRQYSDETVIYIIPDLYVYRVEDNFVIALNEEGFPNLRINNYYVKLMNQNDLPLKAREFIHEKLKSATWLIKSLYQRQRTLYRVATSIFEFQRPFLEKGVGYLRPLVLKDVARVLGLHESTVSRVTTNK